MPHNYTLASLIPTNYMFERTGLTAPFTWSTSFYLISVIFITHWINGTPSTLSVFSLHCLAWNRCCSGAGILTIHCCIITFGIVMNLGRGNLWVSRDCLPAPSPKGSKVGSCANRSKWHVRIHRVRWKEYYDAKRAVVINSSIMGLIYRFFLGTGYQINRSVFPLHSHLCCRLKDSLPKSVPI